MGIDAFRQESGRNDIVTRHVFGAGTIYMARIGEKSAAAKKARFHVQIASEPVGIARGTACAQRGCGALCAMSTEDAPSRL